MNKIETAQAVVTRLEAQLADITNKSIASATDRRSLSFAAHGCGDEKARAELSAANTASAALTLDAENLQSAIHDARARVVEAQREVDAEKRREIARQAKTIIAEAETFGDAMAAGLDTLCEAFTGFSDSLNKLERLEYPVARARLRYLAFTRAVQQRLHQAGLDFTIVPPYLRHSFVELNQMYLDPSRNKVAEDLDEPVADAVEAA
jgi:triphosphoribosyl-dephospho-CoA synthetase